MTWPTPLAGGHFLSADELEFEAGRLVPDHLALRFFHSFFQLVARSALEARSFDGCSQCVAGLQPRIAARRRFGDATGEYERCVGLHLRVDGGRPATIIRARGRASGLPPRGAGLRCVPLAVGGRRVLAVTVAVRGSARGDARDAADRIGGQLRKQTLLKLTKHHLKFSLL